MGKAIPEQHPAVVLRSSYVHLRALLVAAMIALVCLAAAVVILANDNDQIVTTSTPQVGGAVGGAQRYDGGPNEGSADLAPAPNAPARPTERQAFPGLAGQAGEVGPNRYDGGPEEGTRGPGR